MNNRFMGYRGIMVLGTIAFMLCLSPGAKAQGWYCGDVDVSQAVDISDLSYVVDYLFIGGPPPVPYACRGDWNHDATVDISDLNACIDFLFFVGAPPPLHCCDNCSFGYANCDGTDRNGCEVNLNTSPTCGSAFSISSIYGDASCTPASTDRYGRGEAFMRLQVADCPDACTPFIPENFGISLYLTVPPGTDYDLFLYDDACNMLGSSQAGGDADESITYRYNGTCLFVDDSRYFRIEVRLWAGSGSSCDYWHLIVVKDPAKVAPQTPTEEAKL